MKLPHPIVFALAFGMALSSQAQFTPGNLAVLRIGNGSQVLTNTGNSIFIDEYGTNGVCVHSTTIPDSGTSALILSGKASTEGGLSRSVDKSRLLLAAYNTNHGVVTKALSDLKATAVPRAIGVVSIDRSVTILKSMTNLFSGTNPRSVVSNDGETGFWLGGGDDGILFVGGDSPSPVTVESDLDNTRFLSIASGNLFFSTQSKTPGIYTLSSVPGALSPVGLTEKAAYTNLLVSTGSNGEPSGFAFNPTMTTLYVADERTDSNGGVQKWTTDGTTWKMDYTLSVGSGVGAFRIAVDFDQTYPVIFVTTSESTTSNRLVRIIDTGAFATPAVLAKSGWQQSFRGIDFAPDARPDITSQPESQSALTGGDVVFQVAAVSAFPLGYQWQKDAVDISDATNATLSLHAVSSLSQGEYRVIISNTYATVISSNATLTVQTLTGVPTITVPPASQTNYVGGSVTFTVTAGGDAPLAYQWRYNGVDIAGATNVNLTLEDLTFADEGNYTVHVSNGLGSTDSSKAYLAVLPLPPTVTSQPISQTAAVGSTVTFSVVAGGTGPFTYQWNFDGANLADGDSISGATSDVLMVQNLTHASAGSYSVTITGDGGVTNSLTAVLTVIPAPSYVNYSSNGMVYSQNFNGLPNPGTTSVNSDNPVTINSIVYSLGDPFDFGFPVASSGDGGLGLSNTLSGWYGWAESGCKFGAHPGDQTTGGVISFGATNSSATNRALGLLATSSTGATAFGVKFINGTAQTLTQMNLSFTGELWRQQTAAKTIMVGYYIDSTGTNAFVTNSTLLSTLNVSFAVGTAAVAGKTGPLASEQQSLKGQAIEWTPGAALWIVWRMPSSTGSSQGLGIDDFTFSATGSQSSSSIVLSVKKVGTNVVLSWPGASASVGTLQSASSLSGATVWSDAGMSPTNSNGTNTVTLNPSETTRFYRIK